MAEGIPPSTPPIEECDKQPCKGAVQALGTAKDKYNEAKQDLEQIAAGFGLVTTGGIGALIALVAAKVAAAAIPVIGWAVLVVEGIGLGLLIGAYVVFTTRRRQLQAAKEAVRQQCPRKCWPENVLREM